MTLPMQSARSDSRVLHLDCPRYTDAVKEILLFQWRLSDGLESKTQDIVAKQRSIEGWEYVFP